MLNFQKVTRGITSRTMLALMVTVFFIAPVLGVGADLAKQDSSSVMVEFPEWYITLMGVLVPFVIQALKPVTWPRIYRFLVTILIDVATAVIGCAVTGNLAGQDISSAIIWIYVASQTTYQLWWKELFKYWGFKPTRK